MRRQKYHFILLLGVFASCQKTDPNFAGSGVFEAQEIIVSALGTGQILEFQIEEGTSVEADIAVGRLDCDDLALQKSQVEASKAALKLRRVEARPETAVLRKQIATQRDQITTLQTQSDVVKKERDRMKKLVDQDAAPSKQLDDTQGQLDVMQRQIATAQSQLNVLEEQIRSSEQSTSMKNRSIMSEDDPLQSQIARIENQIDNCTIVNPISGTVIAKYAEPFEFIAVGKPLYKVADLSEMTLRAYISGDQLTQMQIGQKVNVKVDDTNDGLKTYDGVVSWIAEKAEFTPKTIQTKDERANLVYAIKVRVKNDGFLRIGMYGELEL
jgi:HlyD family secretion protein